MIRWIRHETGAWHAIELERGAATTMPYICGWVRYARKCWFNSAEEPPINAAVCTRCRRKVAALQNGDNDE